MLTFLLFVTFDLDRPARGFITIPADPLVSLRISMELPPAAGRTTLALASAEPHLIRVPVSPFITI